MQFMSAKLFYTVKQYVKGRDAIYDDFSKIIKRKVMFRTTETEFKRFNKKPLVWRTYEDKNGGILTCTMPYNILKPDGKK